MTIVNPIRSRELWKDKTLKPIETQYGAIESRGLRATWLIQDDVLNDSELLGKIKSFNRDQELGLFLEVSKNLAIKSRVYFDEQRPWYDPGVIFLSGYEIGERKKIIDKMFTDFKKAFGYKPTAVGAWWVDGWSLKYLEDKYQIKTVMIVADQKTTDSYGVWGQWWGYPYHPQKNNVLAPGNAKTTVIQWAQRDWEKAYNGEGWQTSNYSLQANDYTRLGLKTDYFKKLASDYLSVEKLGQITVGLETGIESVGNEKEYGEQLNWLVETKVDSLKMSEFGDKYREMYGGVNPEKVVLGDWTMTPKYRENKKLGERVDYDKKLVFGDINNKDTSSFLNRIYRKDNLVKEKTVDIKAVVAVGLFVLGTIIGIKTRIKWWMIVIGVMLIWIMIHLRYTVIEGEKMIGFLIDNFRFVGIGLREGMINRDMNNLTAKTMLKLKLANLYLAYGLVWGIIGGRVYGKISTRIKNRNNEEEQVG